MGETQPDLSKQPTWKDLACNVYITSSVQCTNNQQLLGHWWINKFSITVAFMISIARLVTNCINTVIIHNGSCFISVASEMSVVK